MPAKFALPFRGLKAGADRERERARMVEAHIAQRGVRDERVLAAMHEVPREAFVDAQYSRSAYDDTPLPIGAGQTISQPYIVAFMIEAAAVQPTDRVLEVGAGSGYAAAVLSRIAREVHTIERLPELVEEARERIERLGYRNIELHLGDGTLGWPEAAPYDVILVAASGPQIPQSLKEQLSIGGRLVMPAGEHRLHQSLRRVTRETPVSWKVQDLGGVSFVPLIGAQGWSDPT